MGEERALVTLSEAIDALERAGNLRAAAVARRDLGSWRLADGDPTGVDDLGAALPTLLRTDRLAAGPALAEIAAAVAPDQAERAALLAGAARHVMRTAPGTSPASLERSRLWSLVQQLTAEQPAAAGAGAAPGRRGARGAGRRSSVVGLSPDHQTRVAGPGAPSPTPGPPPTPPSAVWLPGPTSRPGEAHPTRAP